MSPTLPSFAAAFAHEVMGHNTLDQRKAKAFNRSLYERKYHVIRRGAGPDIQWNEDRNRIDWQKTEDHFGSMGLMQSDTTVKDAIITYYKNHAEYNLNSLRSDISYDYWLDAPQEFYATVANEYYSDSELTLRFAIERAGAGHPNCLDHFLLAAYFLTKGGDTLKFFKITWPYTGVKTKEVRVHRNHRGHIVGISDPDDGRFDYFSWAVDGEGFVTQLHSGTQPEQGLWSAVADAHSLRALREPVVKHVFGQSWVMAMGVCCMMAVLLVRIAYTRRHRNARYLELS